MVSHTEPLSENWANLLIGVSIAMLSSQVMTHHGGFGSVKGMVTVGAGVVIWAYGMSLALDVVYDELEKLRKEIA